MNAKPMHEETDAEDEAVALRSDPEHARLHARLAEQAEAWHQRGGGSAPTLRGSELTEAEAWLETCGEQRPRSTSRQIVYVLASRRAAVRRRWLGAGAVALGLAAAAFFAALALEESRARREQRQVALARSLVAQSRDLFAVDESRLEGAVWRAAEALRRLDTVGRRWRDADSALRRSLALLPRRVHRVDLGRHGPIDHAVFSPGGRYLALIQSRHVQVWDQVERRQAAAWLLDPGLARRLRELAVSDGGGFLATVIHPSPVGTELAALSLWSAAGEELATCPVEGRPEGPLAVGPEGRWLLAGGRVWAAASCRELALWPGQWRRNASAAVSGDGRWLAAAVRLASGHAWQVQIRDLNDGAPVDGWALEQRVNWLRFVAGGRRLAAGSRQEARLWDLEGRFDAAGSAAAVPPEDVAARLRPVPLLRRDEVSAESSPPPLAAGPLPGSPAALSADGRHVAWVSDLQLAKLTALGGDGEELLRFVHGSLIADLAGSPDGRFLTTLGLADRQARVWEVAGGREVRLPVAEEVQHLFWSPDGRFLVAAEGQQLTVWRVEDWSKAHALPAAAPLGALAGSADGTELLALAGAEVRRWDLASGRPSAAASAAPAGAVSLSPGGRYLSAVSGWPLAEGEQSWARLVELASGGELTRLDFAEPVLGAAFCPDEHRLAVTGAQLTRAGWRGGVELWDVPGARRLARYELAGYADDRLVRRARCSLDGERLATAGGDAVSVWQLDGGGRVTPPLFHVGLSAFELDPSGAYLATAGRGGARIWQLSSGENVAVLPAGDNLTGLAWSPDGRTLATAGPREVRVWLWRPGDLIELACTHLRGNPRLDDWQSALPEEPYRPLCPGLPVP